MISNRTLAVAFIAIVVILAGCGSGASTAPSAGGMVISGAWARPSMSMQGTVAVYMTVKNETLADDAIVGASTTIAKAELHETVAGDSGMMGMQPVAKVAIAKGATVEFKSGGYHVMLVDMTTTLAVGQTVEVTLTFEHAAPVKFTAEVKAN